MKGLIIVLYSWCIGFYLYVIYNYFVNGINNGADLVGASLVAILLFIERICNELKG